MADATADKMRTDLRELNTKVADTAASLSGETRQHFMQRTAAAMETMALQTDLKGMQERGQTHIDHDTFAKMAGPAAEKILARAREIERVEEQEAATAREVAARSVEREHRDAGNPSADPASLQQTATDRDLTRQAETIAARERSEAHAASLVARDLAQNPGQPINPNNVEDERLAALQREQAQAIKQAKASEKRSEDGDDTERERPHRHKM